MLKINIHYNPEIDSIDIELTNKRMELIHEKFTYALCQKHPESENELAYKASDGKDFAAPIKFCCKEYANKTMRELNEFLYQHPIQAEPS